ncbi:MAG: hypothetical protein HYZ29_17575 [Myxococcales bacterium]|nr:hypothetical protein [Myxococcales bacterium]
MAVDPPDPRAFVAELRALGALPDLIAAVRAARDQALASSDRTFPRASVALDPAQGETPLGNLAAIFERGADTESEALLIALLLALGTASDFPSAPETELSRAKELAWLAAHTRINALLVMDSAIEPEKVGAFWRALASLAEPSRAEDPATATAALAALAASGSERGRAAALELATSTRDPLVRALLGRGSAATAPRLDGELSPAPRGPIATTLLALTGLLFVARGARLLGRLGLAFKQPAEVRLTDRGLELSHRTELLGRVLKKHETLIPLTNLARVTREVRYPRVGLYLGLFALALGSYVGVGLFVDGARVPGGSAQLLGMGLVVVALGLAIDYGLTVLSDNARGRCRLVVEPKKGRRLCVGALDPARADAMLAALSQQGRG